MPLFKDSRTMTDVEHMFSRYILDAIRQKEDKGTKPLAIEASVIMDMMVRDAFGTRTFGTIYGLEYKVNPKLQGIALIVRDEEDI